MHLKAINPHLNEYKNRINMKNDNHFCCLEYNFKQLVPRSKKKELNVKKAIYCMVLRYNCCTATTHTGAIATDKCFSHSFFFPKIYTCARPFFSISHSVTIFHMYFFFTLSRVIHCMASRVNCVYFVYDGSLCFPPPPPNKSFT